MKRLPAFAEAGLLALVGAAQTFAFVATALWPLQLAAVACRGAANR